MGKIWRYKNKTTHTELETNDLAFLLNQLSEIERFIVPNKLMSDIILRGKSELSLSNKEGAVHNIIVTEEDNCSILH